MTKPKSKQPPKKAISDDDAEKAQLRHADLKTIRLGTYPFLAGIRYYAACQQPNLRASTIQEDTRKLRQFNTLFEQLHHSGVLPTTDPRHFTQAHISEFLLWMRNRTNPLDNTAQAKYVQILDRYLRVFHNFIIRDLKDKRELKFPHSRDNKPIKALDVDELQRVFDASAQVDGWRGIMARGYIAISFGAALRPKEALLAEEGDIRQRNPDEWYFYVRHPKAEGDWGNTDEIPILRKDMYPKIAAFLTERQSWMEGHGLKSRYLFFNQETGQPYSRNGFRCIVKKVARLSGVDFMLKEMRPTFTSVTVDDDMTRLDAVSLQLRHASADMTRQYYAKINRDHAIKKGIGDVWKDHEIR